MAHADVNGQRLFYTDTGGDGPPVVFSHGFLMDHSMWDPQIAACRDEFRCVAYDERGWGATEFDGKPYTYYDLADDVIGLLDHLEIEQATLVGMSQGGFLGLRDALTHPDRVKALVLVDTQAGVDDEQTNAAYRAMHDQWVGPGDHAPVAQAVASIILGPDEKLCGPWIAKWLAMPRENLSVPFECLVGRDDITDEVRQVTQPALVIHGTEDAAIGLDRAEELCEALPACAGLVRIEGGTHAANLTHPDQVSEALLEFLREYA